MIVVFQNQLTTALTAIRHGTCERVDTVQHQEYHQHTFPEVTPLEDLGPGGDKSWSELTPAGGGFLWLRYNETFDMPWGISMFHGIHCLQMLRGEFQSQLGIRNGGGHHHHRRQIATQNDEPGEGADLVHLGHCLAYIVEILQCVGDSTIEPPWVKTDEKTGAVIDHGVDGAGEQHQCRDIGHLWAAAERTEQEAGQMWDYKPGDTVERVFGDL